MSIPKADRVALILLALLACAAIGPGLMPWNVFASVHSAVRPPFSLSMTAAARAEASGRGNFDTGDQTFQVIPEREAFLRAIGEGHWPLWWPEAGGGVPLLGAPAAELAEPRTLILGLWLGPSASLGVLAALGLFTLSAVTYLFFRLRGLSPVAAGVGAVAFAYAGSLTASLFYQCKIDCLVLLPGGLAAVEWWLRGRRAAAFALLFAAAADSALASFQQGTAVAVYLVAALGGARLYACRAQLGGVAPALRAGGALAAAGLLGLAVGAIHLLPVLDAISQSGRTATAGSWGFTLNAAHLLTMIAPFVIGDPTSTPAAAWNPLPEIIAGLRDAQGRYIFVETVFYGGIVTLPLAAAGMALGRRTAAVSAALLLCLAASAGAPLALLPGLSVGAPSRILPGAAFALAWLAAEGLDAVRENKRCCYAAAAGAAVVAALGLGAFALRAAVRGEKVGDRGAAMRSQRARDEAAARGIAATLPPEDCAAKMSKRWDKEARPWLLVSSILCIGSAAAIAVWLKKPRFAPLLPVVLAADLGLFVHHVAPALPAVGFLKETPTIAAVREAAGDARIARVAPDDTVGEKDHLLFQACLASAVGVRDTSAYVVLPNALQVGLAGLFTPEAVFQGTFLGAFPRRALDLPVLDLLGVRVVVSRAPLRADDLRPVVEREEFYAYSRTNNPGRAWIVPRMTPAADQKEAAAKLRDPAFRATDEVIVENPPADSPRQSGGGGTVRVIDRGPNEVVLLVQGTGGGYLIESAPAANGWRASLDGFPVPALRADGALRAVFVPPGDHEVRWNYLPASFLIGAAVSAFACAAGIVWIARLAARREGSA